jgi:hypothetical protein
MTGIIQDNTVMDAHSGPQGAAQTAEENILFPVKDALPAFSSGHENPETAAVAFYTAKILRRGRSVFIGPLLLR